MMVELKRILGTDEWQVEVKHATFTEVNRFQGPQAEELAKEFYAVEKNKWTS